MSAYHKEWARRRRSLLFDVLGNKCAHSHNGNCKGELQVDCIIPCGDKHHRMDTSARQSFYHQQLRQHNLQLLCEYHNAIKDNPWHKKKKHKKQQQIQQAEQPF